MLFAHRKWLALAAAIVVAVAGYGVAAEKDPIVGQRFLKLASAQDASVQRHLERTLRETDGFFVSGPLDPLFEVNDWEYAHFLGAVRVVCADETELKRAEDICSVTEGLDVTEREEAGVLVAIRDLGGEDKRFLLLTVQQLRFLIWAADLVSLDPTMAEDENFQSYSNAVLAYLRSGGAGLPRKGLVATDHGLPQAVDFYAKKPDYVINGYDNYKAFLYRHSEIKTNFAHGIVAFIPTDSLLGAMKDDAPPAAFPNKEFPMLQHEYKKFFERGGDVRVIKTLTPETAAELVPGEYFYAVGLNGNIRYGYETPREEIDRIEEETGRKLARANHAFLFPGEPVLTAGAFIVAAGSRPRISHVSAHSGHYFYSNVTKTVREDIAVKSDEYVMTLGHFFVALDRAGISYHSIVISKL